MGGRLCGSRNPRHLRGHGSVGKDIVAGVLDWPTRLISATVVSDQKRSTLLAFVVEQIESDAMVYTDEWWAYGHSRTMRWSGTRSGSGSMGRRTRTAWSHSGRC